MNSKNASTLVDHFFRNEFGKVVALLTSKFGTQHLEAAEDAVQEALIKAMNVWGYGQIPDNPSGWIIRVAQNKLIDHLRRMQKVYYATQIPEGGYEIQLPNDEQFKDEMIKMMFACCNPRLSIEYQIILTLKILGGLSVREIASALLKKGETIAKAYTRAKKQFKTENLRLEFPSEKTIQSRLEVVLKVIYLLFNEGYKCSEGDQIIRKDLCEEAMRLNQLLLDKPETNNEWSRSLMALMHFQAARFEARVDELGVQITLENQDRAKWDQRHILLGNKYLVTITSELNSYFLQAAINGLHCAASSYEETDWASILTLYNQLYTLNKSPIVAINRIYPLSKVHGAETAINQLNLLRKETLLENNYLIPATEAELQTQLHQYPEAIKCYQEAMKMCQNDKEVNFFEQKIKLIREKVTL